MPLYIDKNQENLPVIALYPPPQLHCGIHGPVNNIIEKLEKLFPADLAKYCALFHIKGGGPGGQYDGPTLKKILDNTEGRLYRLSNIVSKHGEKYMGNQRLSFLGMDGNGISRSPLLEGLEGLEWMDTVTTTRAPAVLKIFQIGALLFCS